MIIFFVTFTVFFIEAIIHYNIGKSGKLNYNIEFPELHSLSQIVIIIAIFSFINSRLISFIYSHFKIK